MALRRSTIQKRIDRLMDKMDSVPVDDKYIATQAKLLGQMVGLAKQDSAALHVEIEQRRADALKITEAFNAMLRGRKN